MSISVFCVFLAACDGSAPVPETSEHTWLSIISITFSFLSVLVGLYSLYKTRRNGLITYPPGSLLEKIIMFLFSKKTAERVFLTTIADMQGEYLEALARNEKWKSRWVRVRCFIVLVISLGAYFPSFLLDEVMDKIKDVAK